MFGSHMFESIDEDKKDDIITKVENNSKVILCKEGNRNKRIRKGLSKRVIVISDSLFFAFHCNGKTLLNQYFPPILIPNTGIFRTSRDHFKSGKTLTNVERSMFVSVFSFLGKRHDTSPQFLT